MSFGKLGVAILLVLLSFSVAHPTHILGDAVNIKRMDAINKLNIAQAGINKCTKDIKRNTYLVKEARSNLEYLETFKIENIVDNTQSVIDTVLAFKPEPVVEINESMDYIYIQRQADYKAKEAKLCLQSLYSIDLSYHNVRYKIKDVVLSKESAINDYSANKGEEFENCKKINDSNQIIINKIIRGETKYQDSLVQLDNLLKTLNEEDLKFKDYTAELLDKIDRLISQGSQKNDQNFSMMVVDATTTELKNQFYNAVKNSVSENAFTGKSVCDISTRQGKMNTFLFGS